MSLSAGTRLGPYEILAPLGAGGMGEAVSVSAGSTFEAGVPRALFQTRVNPSTLLRVSRNHYVVGGDGQRFLINTPPAEAGPTPMTVVVNWSAGLNR